MADFAEWLTNGQPPWAAYRDLLSVIMIAMYKWTEVRPDGLCETWCKLMMKYVLQVTGQEAKAAFGTG